MSVAAGAGGRVRDVRVERRGALVRVVLDRPPLNILTTEMLNALDSALAELSSDPGVSVLLLTGAGRAFCAGADVAEHTADRAGALLEAFHRVLERVRALEAPVVCAVNGSALGGGLELALACDVVLVREGASLGVPEVRLGVFPPFAAAVLPTLIGEPAAMDLILSGRTVDAAEAVHMGLASRALPAAAFEEEVEAYTGALAALSRPVLRLAKRAVRAGGGAGGGSARVAAALDTAESLYLEELVRLQDAREGIAAFLGKRAPRWRNA